MNKISLNKFISNSLDPKTWCNFLLHHSLSNIFQTPEMYDVYKNTSNYEPVFLSVANEKNEVLGILLAVIQKEHNIILGKFSARSIVWGGPLIKDNNIEVLDFLLREYNKIIRKKAIYTQFRNLWEWNKQEKKVFANNGFEYEEHLDIIHDLTVSPEGQLMKMNQGRRKNIRRAIKQDVILGEIKTKQELLTSLDLIKNTYKKVKLPLPDDSYFLEVFDYLNSKGLVKFFKASYKEKLIGVRYVFCYNNLIYDWFAGSSEADLDKYPNDFLPWKVMEWGHQNGYKAFDFGGAGKPNEAYGVRNYKLKFGGELVNWGRFEKVHQPIFMKLGKLGFKLYKKIKR